MASRRKPILYTLVVLTSLYIRNFVLPNPFEQLPRPISIPISTTRIVLPAICLNVLAEPILQAITFAIVGIYYAKGVDPPIKGSILYLFFFCVHVTMLYIVSSFQFSPISVITAIIIYIMAQLGIATIKNKFLYKF